MVWALAIVCVSLSCEPLPILAGWFDSDDECDTAARMVLASWKPMMGFYQVGCIRRTIV